MPRQPIRRQSVNSTESRGRTTVGDERPPWSLHTAPNCEPRLVAHTARGVRYRTTPAPLSRRHGRMGDGCRRDGAFVRPHHDPQPATANGNNTTDLRCVDKRYLARRLRPGPSFGSLAVCPIRCCLIDDGGSRCLGDGSCRCPRAEGRAGWRLVHPGGYEALAGGGWSPAAVSCDGGGGGPGRGRGPGGRAGVFMCRRRHASGS